MLLAEVLSGYKGQLSLLISALLLLSYATAGRNEYLPTAPMKVLYLVGFFILHHIKSFFFLFFFFLQGAPFYFKA